SQPAPPGPARHHRRDVHDRARALAAHGFPERERRDERAVQVELQHLVECVQRHVEHRPVVAAGARDVASRGVDEDVHPAAGLEHLVPGRADLGPRRAGSAVQAVERASEGSISRGVARWLWGDSTIGTASLGAGSWLKAAQIPAGGDVSSMNPIETSARARMRGAKLTASKYAAVRPTSGRSTSQFGYGAARPCSGPSKSQPAGTCAMSAVTRVSSPATANPCWPPMLVPITTSVLPFRSARLARYSAAR